MTQALNECKVYYFADDTNLIFSDPDPKQIKNVMNKDLKLLYEWLCANPLSLNVAKNRIHNFSPNSD